LLIDAYTASTTPRFIGLPRPNPATTDGRIADHVHPAAAARSSTSCCWSTLNSGGMCGGSLSFAGVENGPRCAP
jgi:hypothetical protein